MKSVFVDFATVSRGDLDVTALEEVLPGIELIPDCDGAELATHVADAEIVLLNKAHLDAGLLGSARALRLVVLAATGINNVDLSAARARGIAVCNVRAYCTASVVQHVIGGLLAVTHHFARYQALLQGGAWRQGPHYGLLDDPIRELTGRRLGIVGYGELGRGVAQAASALGMEIAIANRPGADRQPGRSDLAELLPIVDVLSLHCPLTPATAGLIGARELALMKSDAVLINTARGALVDAEALADALRSGTIGGAVIDVLTQEPPADGNPLLDPALPNLVLTPHIAWAAREARQRALDQMVENVRSFLDGGTLRRVD